MSQTIAFSTAPVESYSPSSTAGLSSSSRSCESRDVRQMNSVLKSVLFVTSGSLFIAALSQLMIPLPFTPVPLSGQTLAVLLVAAALGSKRGVAAVALYLAEGIAGLPFFAGGTSGFGVFSGATAGYLVGFLVAAYIVGTFAERGWDRHFKSALPAFILGQLSIYVMGSAWLAYTFHGQLSFITVLMMGVVPFLVGDALKTVIASSSLPFAWKWVNRQS